MKFHLGFIALPVCCFAGALFSAEVPAIDFEKQIKPILADRCVECHNTENSLGELNLQNKERAMQARKEGPVIVPNQPEASRLYLVLTLPVKDKKAMPATGHRIAKAEISLIKQWIQEGAKWPKGKAGSIPTRKKAVNET